MVLRNPPLRLLKKGILPPIHHPILTERESQHFLESITSSFRKNLDREHPWETVETSINPLVNTRTDSAEPRSATSHRPTDRHLRAILSNPLFAHPRNGETSTSTYTAPSNTMPCDVFDSAVSKGLMTTRRAAGFLATVRARLLAESPDNLRQRMGASGAGLRVLRWLRASGQENHLDFLSDPVLIRLLIPFLYAEGLQEVAWMWLAQLASQAAELGFKLNPGKPNAQSLSELMSAIVTENSESDTQVPVALDGSFAALVKANDMLPRENSAATAALKSTWARLSWASTVNALERPKPSVALFEDFVNIGRPLKLTLDLAHLDLHHPTTPTHSAAVEYLRLRQQIIKDVSKMKAPAQQRVLCLILDAAERLKRTGQVAEAPWVERIRSAIYESLNLGILNIQTGDSLNSNMPLRNMI